MSTPIFLHLDGNSFYCSCERLFRPELRGKPVVVLSNNDGCIVALTKEARAVGLKRGMPLFKVKDIVEANKVAVLSSNYELYNSISGRMASRDELSDKNRFSKKVLKYLWDDAFRYDRKTIFNLDLLPENSIEGLLTYVKESEDNFLGILSLNFSDQ